MSYFLDNTDANRRVAANHRVLRPGVLVMLALAWVLADLMARFSGHVDVAWLSGLDAFAALVLFIGVGIAAIQARIAKTEQDAEQYMQQNLTHRRMYVVDGGSGLPRISPEVHTEQKPAALTCIDGGSFSPNERG